MSLYQHLEASAPRPAQRHSRMRRAGGALWSLLSWSVVATAVVALLAALAIVLVPRVLGWQGVVVLSGSMEPALETGGVAFVEPKRADEVKVGDILTFRAPGNPRLMISHRVIGISQATEGVMFQTKGDANTDADTRPVSAGQVIGTVRVDFPYLGRVIDSLRSGDNYYLFIGIPAALLILSELWTVARELRRHRARLLEGSSPAEGASS
jgi:signal peptidase